MYILGLSFDTDASASLLKDGVPIAAAAEERFTRVKHDRDFPNQALECCLANAGIQMEDVAWAAMGWNPGIHLRPLLWRQSSRVRHHAEYLSAVPNMLLQKRAGRPRSVVVEQTLHFGEDQPPLRVAYVDHHLSHAAWAFVSGFDEAAILTVDGFGETTSTMRAALRDDHIQVLGQVERPHSLGSLYAAITQYLGFTPNKDEGTVMSLAAMAEPRFVDDFRRMVRLDADAGTFELDLSYFSFYQESTQRVSQKFIDKYGPVRSNWEDEITEQHKAIAASLQLVFEEVYIGLARHLQQETGLKDLVVAGGVALNCVANGRLLAETDFDRLFIPPASGDDGVATGAALYLHHDHLKLPRAGHTFRHAFLGHDVEDAEVEELLQVSSRRYRHLPPEITPRVAARLLSSDKIIGWCQGKAEFGPRALGNRSIVTSPGSLELKDRLNASVKFRLGFRPFAPSMLADRVADLFEGGGLTPFMLMAYTAKPQWRDRIIGILHFDDTARVQTVEPDENPRYHQLISHFDKLTGVPVVLNTSLNVRGEPIANTAKDALACFDTSGMEYLFLGDHVLCKEDPALEEALEQAIVAETEGGSTPADNE